MEPGKAAFSEGITNSNYSPSLCSYLWDFFSLDTVKSVIVKYGYNKVALQFPDELLKYSVQIALLLENKNYEIYIMGDTPYGSCCVDEITAEHVCADLIIHFGRACLSKVERVPVLYIFGKHAIDVEDAVEKILELIEDNHQPALLLYDVIYYHSAELLFSNLLSKLKNLIYSRLSVPDTFDPQTRFEIKNNQENKFNTEVNDFGRIFELLSDTKIEDYLIIFIGSEGPTLTSMMLYYNQSKFLSYDPLLKRARIESVAINKTLMKRYYLIEKAKDARLVGILLGTLGSGKYKEITEYMKRIIKNAGKKPYIFMLGRVSDLKIANFIEIDIFVLLACPESSFLDSKNFYRPVITPFEMQLACVRSLDWTGEFTTDFHKVLFNLNENSENYDSEEEGDFSLINGRYRVNKNVAEVSSREICALNKETLVVTAKDFLNHRRGYRGLDKALHVTEVRKAVAGSTGLPRGYIRMEENSEVNKFIRHV